MLLSKYLLGFLSTFTGLLQCNGQEEATLTEILKHLEKAYCGQLSAEIQHIVVGKQSEIVLFGIIINRNIFILM